MILRKKLWKEINYFNNYKIMKRDEWVKIPCGQTLGHGYCCNENDLCSTCRYILKLESKIKEFLENLPSKNVNPDIYSAEEISMKNIFSEEDDEETKKLKAQKFLQKTGIYNEDGSLSDNYK